MQRSRILRGALLSTAAVMSVVLWLGAPSAAQQAAAPGAPVAKSFKMLAFDFGPDEPGQVTPGWIGVCEKDFYTREKGYGWKTHLKPLTSELRKTLLEIPSYSDEKVAQISPFNSRGEISKMVRLGLPLLLPYNNRHSQPSRYNQKWGVKIAELDTLLDRDNVRGSRTCGFYYDPRIRQECLETRGAIFIDDDLSTEFLLDLPNGDYTMLIGLGDNKHGHYRLSPWHVDAEGVRRLSVAPRCLIRRKIEDVQVRDGQLNVRFYVDRNGAMTYPWPWNTFAAWAVNYIVVMPAKETEAITAKEEKIERDHYEHLKDVVFVSGERTESYIRDGCLVVNDKPLFQISVHNFGGILRDFPNDLRQYPYYCFANTIGITVGRTLSSAHFMQSRWQQRSYYDDYPFMTIGRMNDCYKANFLVRLATAQAFMNFMPRYLRHESATMEDSRGNSLGRAPLNSDLSRELTREAYIMLSAHLKDHPALIGYEIWDEMPHMGVRYGHDVKSIVEYHKWLEEKYGDIDALNAEWKTKHKAFDEIVPPKKHESTANFANFYRFVSHCMTRQVMETRDVLKKLEPFHTTHGGKGQGTGVEDNSWYRVPAAEVLRVEIAPNVGRAACEHFKHALEAGRGDCGCPWAYYYPGVKRLGQRRPGPERRRYTGPDARTSGYAFVMRKIFDGVKSNWWEEYNNPASHVFHRTAVMRRLAGKGRIRRWTGELIFFDKEAYDGADIYVCPGALELSRAHQLAYRLSPLFLPARPPRSDVALAMTWNSFIPIRRHPSAYRTLGLHWQFDKFLKGMQVPHDVIREPIFDNIKDYKVVILGPWSWALTPDLAKKLTDYVARGGVLIFLDNAATGDARNVSESNVFPVFGLDRVAGFKRTGRKWELTPDAKVLAGAARSPQAVRGKAGKVYYFDFKGMSKTDAPTLRKLLREAFKAGSVRQTVSLEADKEPEKIDADVLVGKGFALVGVSTICQSDQKITLRMHFLKPGRYDVVDVTGERPKTVKDEYGSGHHAPDAQYRHSWYVARDVTAGELATKGVQLDVQARAGRVLAVRKSDLKVWVDAPDYELRGILLQERRFKQREQQLKVTIVPVRIVLPDKATPAVSAAAKRIAGLLKDAGVSPEIVTAADVKTRTVKHEARVQHDGSDPGSETEAYLVDTFVNQLVVGDTHLVCLGSEANNPLIAHLGKINTFAYDKVLEKTTAKYPGPGRGIIQVVDSVNSALLDPRHSTRDAVLVGGSDEAGTLLAVEKLCEILGPRAPEGGAR